MDNAKKFCCLCLILAFLGIALAIQAQETADINNVFGVVVNNTNLAPTIDISYPGTGERISGNIYYANDSPIQIFLFAHGMTAGQNTDIKLQINGTRVSEVSSAPIGVGQENNKSIVVIIPKGANYSAIFSNYHHYEWREYLILSGKNGTLNVTQILNVSGNFVPYVGANQNITVGVNNFTIFSADSNSSIYLPNLTNGGILIQQFQNAAHTVIAAVSIDGSVLLGTRNDAVPMNATYNVTSASHTFRVNNTDKVVINKDGLSVSNITSVGINNGDYPNSTLQATKVNKTNAGEFTGGTLPDARLNGSVLLNYTLHYTVGSFSRDTTTASGTQTVTGTGFKPSAIKFTSGSNGAVTNMYSNGYDDGTNAFTVYTYNGVTANTFVMTTGYSIYYIQSAGNTYAGKIQSFDNNGFTIVWTKTGTPSGTMYIAYEAER